MDDSRQNSPSRKSRFRSQPATTRRPAEAGDDVPVNDEDAAVYADEHIEADAPAEAYPETPIAGTDHGAHYASEELPPGLPAEESHLAAGLRLTRSADELPPRGNVVSAWAVVLTGLVCLLLGGGIGYLLHPQTGAAAASAKGEAANGGKAPVLPLAPATLADVDAAFSAIKQAQFADARARFGALGDKHPDWWSMRIEAARAALYQHDFEGAQQILVAQLRTGPNVDAEFLTGLLEMTLQDYEKSEAAFARAVALDPARPDVFYFWGECLRREGKPQDAADKFRAAALRNQYETAEGLYQLKLWLSEIQADQEAAKGSNVKIDADLASGHPSGAALFAAAARDIKATKYQEAGERIGQAQKVMEPAVFRVILQDPTFLQEGYRPELAPFYKP